MADDPWCHGDTVHAMRIPPLPELRTPLTAEQMGKRVVSHPTGTGHRADHHQRLRSGVERYADYLRGYQVLSREE